MKLKDLDVIDFMNFFEEGLNRGARLDKQRKIQLRRKVRNELYALMGWELATPEAVMSRWEERLDDVFMMMPYGFKDDLFKLLAEKLKSSRTKREIKTDGQQPNRP
jgi:hypothetical protein